jgi:hypothetical protein
MSRPNSVELLQVYQLTLALQFVLGDYIANLTLCDACPVGDGFSVEPNLNAWCVCCDGDESGGCPVGLTFPAVEWFE